MKIDASLRAMLAALLVMAGMVGMAQSAGASPVTFAFTAADVSGREASGYFFYDTTQRPTFAVGGSPWGGGSAEFGGWTPLPVMGVGIEVDGFVAEATSNDRRYFPFEYFMSDNAPHDSFALTVLSGPIPSGPGFRFYLGLRDDTATVFDTFLTLPSALDLDRFNGRTISASQDHLDPSRRFSFSGTITSLAAVPRSAAVINPALIPEPSSLVNGLLGLGLAGGGGYLIRRRGRGAA